MKECSIGLSCRSMGGFSSVVFLCIVTLITLVTLSSRLYVKRSVEMFSEEVLSLKLKSEASNEMWRKNSFNCTRAATKKLGCGEISRKLNTICGGSLSLKGVITATDRAFPLYNYNRLFRDFSDCDYRSGYTFNNLTPGSVQSAKTCEYSLGAFAYSQKVYNGNFVSPNVAFLGVGLADSNTLAATGVVDVENLFVTLPTLIVAGGDLRIKRLIVAKDILPLVTLVSATGTVKLGEASTSVSLYVVSYYEPELPSGARTIKNLKTPDVLSDIPYRIVH